MMGLSFAVLLADVGSAVTVVTGIGFLLSGCFFNKDCRRFAKMIFNRQPDSFTIGASTIYTYAIF